MIRWLLCFVLFFILQACAGKLMQYEKMEELQKNNEFERSVKIIVPEAQEPKATLENTDKIVPTLGTSTPPLQKDKKKIKKIPVELKKQAAIVKNDLPLKHEPSIEDGSPFIGRRPLVDPYRVGESVVLDVKYLGLTAGYLTMKVDPFAVVNGKHSYSFVTMIQSYPAFSKMVYEVNDKAVTWVNYDTLQPEVFSLHVRESGQIKEGQAFFDLGSNKATYWEKKVTNKYGKEERKKEWEILPYSQNVFSAVFYMRLFPWEVGKEYSFRVAEEDDNVIFKGKAIRKEILESEIGTFKTIVVKPEFEVKGLFKPVGDIYFWLTDDDRKLVVRIEAKIQIGTLVCELKNIIPGTP